MRSTQYCCIENIMWFSYSCETSTRTINTKALSMQETLFSRNVDPRRRKCLTINQEQVCYLQKRQSTNDSTSNGRSTRREVRRFNGFYKCWSWLLWPIHCKDWAKKWKLMMLSVHFPNYDSDAYRSCTQVGHRQLSQRNYEIYCTKRQTEHNPQWQRDKLCWSWKRLCRVRCGMEEIRDRRTSQSRRNQMEVHSTRSTSLWRSMGAVGEKLQESNV